MPSTDLTIVLPLKGRPLFTLRYLWYANRCALPYKILIADGEVREPLATMLEGGGLFPNLDIEYVRYGDDTSYSMFYRKMADILRRVRTPYVMMTDNDDFVVLSGITRCVDFLQSNPDYMSCGAGVAGFSVSPAPDDPFGQLLGPVDRISYRYSGNYRSRDLDGKLVSERVIDGYRNYVTTYYNVFRTPALATIQQECADIDFSDLELHESYFAMRALVLGKIRSDASCISYFRQYGTSMGSAFRVDWVHHLLRSRFTGDFNTMVDRISALACADDGSDPEPVAEEIRNVFGDGLRISLSRRYAPASKGMELRTRLRSVLPQGLLDVLRRARQPVGRARQELFDSLKQDGASEVYLATFRRELAEIEDVLTGAEFASFLRPLAPAIAEAAE